MSHPYVLLGLAVVFEVAWAVMLKQSKGFTVLWASAVMLVAYLLSLFFLNLACKTLDLSLAYAVWTGSGATIVALFGVLVFHERLDWSRGLGLALVVGGVVILLGFEEG
jgi:multidrug transporter EmrE-like cation transporter